jgi:hypothetical protein
MLSREANLKQSYHIGILNYDCLKNDKEFKKVYKSQEDVEKFEKFFGENG